MTLTNRANDRRQLNEASLKELALAYVARYATTRAKLRAYLLRKVRERGWSGERPANVEWLADHLSELGYVDDAGYALSKARALAARGYGKRRLVDQLRLAGVEDGDRAEATAHADEELVEAGLRFARRRRIGPFANGPAGPREREKWTAAMVRAGHPYELARAIVAIAPGAEVDVDALQDCV